MADQRAIPTRLMTTALASALLLAPAFAAADAPLELFDGPVAEAAWDCPGDPLGCPNSLADASCRGAALLVTDSLGNVLAAAGLSAADASVNPGTGFGTSVSSSSGKLLGVTLMAGAIHAGAVESNCEVRVAETASFTSTFARAHADAEDVRIGINTLTSLSDDSTVLNGIAWGFPATGAHVTKGTVPIPVPCPGIWTPNIRLGECGDDFNGKKLYHWGAAAHVVISLFGTEAHVFVGYTAVWA